MSPDESEERITYLRPAALPGIELLVGYNSARRWRVFHETYTFCGCETAAAGWRYRNKELPLSDRTNMLMEPGETHCNTVVHKAADFKVVFINPEVFINGAKELGLPVTPHLRFGYSNDPGMFSALYRFCEAVETGEGILEQQSWLAACMQIFLQHAERKPPTMVVSNGQRAVEKVKCYLRERFRESVTLDELSTLSGLSRYHLVRTFSKLVGIPPHAYQNRIRVERAKMLLRTGIPAAHAAVAVGFADQSHFTRHFKKTWGFTPGHYFHAIV